MPTTFTCFWPAASRASIAPMAITSAAASTPSIFGFDWIRFSITCSACSR